MPGILKLQTNVPEVLEFQFAEGKEVQSDFTGQQFLFTLVDGRRVYLPPVAAAKIREAGIGARTPFEICRKQVGRSVEFQISTPNAETAGTLRKSAPAATPFNTHQQETLTPHNTPVAPPAAPAPAAAPPSRAALALMGAMTVAIDAVAEAEVYAAGRGLSLTFVEADVRALAITVFIQNSKGGAA